MSPPIEWAITNNFRFELINTRKEIIEIILFADVAGLEDTVWSRTGFIFFWQCGDKVGGRLGDRLLREASIGGNSHS